MVKSGLLCVLLLCAESLAAQRFSVVITELMADPVPSVGLPAEEYIELTNVSGRLIDLSRWRLTNGRTTGQFPDSVFLYPDSILILCANRAYPYFQPYGRVIILDRFPVISNSGDTLVLQDANLETVHAVAWHPSLLPEGKNDGGWSLEMVNKNLPCSFRQNWKASENTSGGTPGKPNSLDTATAVVTVSLLVHAHCPDPYRVVLEFDDAIDPNAAGNISLYESDLAPVIVSAKAIPPLFHQVELQLADSLKKGNIHWLSAAKVPACDLHPSGATRRVKVGLPAERPEGLVINELMNNPPAGGADYVELFNAGSAAVNLQQLSFGNRNSRGEIASVKQLATTPRYLFPGDYIALTTDPGWLQHQYHTIDPFALLQSGSLPSWPDQRGHVLLLNQDNQVMDELPYDESWHFELVRNQEGVALERTDPAKNTSERTNWHSAAMHAGYGTPGYKNSQSLEGSGKPAAVWLEAPYFSPDGDGQNESCNIQYRFPVPGYVCSIRIYDRTGQPVRNLVSNGLCGTAGQFAWDGRNDGGKLLPASIYILVTETFHLSGKTKRYRIPVTLARPFR
ncbi:lamin tail domain-containing protein [Flavihumibacter stibioxidans]|uniref:LTD domain-containing protein n=1 Tax=Flavihumibacter stibioxidans TaxID=1834163 RepID=A0ABR7MB82_9BACT|nr:lamin tail domain-containing protein [Flavihumibacter stibioxidans]MBC6491769.1 hypothetical protein [Flavihumibacter stibioxidans]